MLLTAAGQAVLKLKTPCAKAPHTLLSPLEFWPRLVELIPQPRPQLICAHGMLAPITELGALVVPLGAGACAGVAGHRGALTRARSNSPRHGRTESARLGTALLKRVVDIDMLHSPSCGGARGCRDSLQAVWCRPAPQPLSL